MYANVNLFPLNRPKLTMVEIGVYQGLQRSTVGQPNSPKFGRVYLSWWVYRGSAIFPKVWKGLPFLVRVCG